MFRIVPYLTRSLDYEIEFKVTVKFLVCMCNNNSKRTVNDSVFRLFQYIFWETYADEKFRQSSRVGQSSIQKSATAKGVEHEYRAIE